jgi:hypothetical protein
VSPGGGGSSQEQKRGERVSVTAVKDDVPRLSGSALILVWRLRDDEEEGENKGRRRIERHTQERGVKGLSCIQDDRRFLYTAGLVL